RRPAENTAKTEQTESQPKQRPQIANFKMSSPSARKPGSSSLSATPAPEIADLTSAVGGASATSILSPALPGPPRLPAPAPIKVLGEQKLIYSTKPMYPAVARQSNTQGVVVVSADIDTKGNVTNTKAVSGPLSLREAAMESVRQWKYSPALIDGKP